MSIDVPRFRLILVASGVSGVVGAVLDTLVPGLLPPALAAAYHADQAVEPGFTGVLILAAFAAGVLIASVAAYVGLYLLKPWSRPLALWSTIAAGAVSPLIGPTVASGWSETLVLVASTLWGVVLAAAYWSPIAASFRNR